MSGGQHDAPQPITASTEQVDSTNHAAARALNFSGPFFDCRTAMAYIPSKSLNATYQWLKRHGVERRANGSIAKVDLDRALDAKRRRRWRMSPAQLANLRKRKAS